MKKTGVVTLHGIGNQQETSILEAELRKILKPKAPEDLTAVVKSVYYHARSRLRQADALEEV